MIKYYKSIYKTDKIQFIYSMGNIFEVVKSVPLKGNMHAASDGVLVSTSDLIFQTNTLYVYYASLNQYDSISNIYTLQYFIDFSFVHSSTNTPYEEQSSAQKNIIVTYDRSENDQIVSYVLSENRQQMLKATFTHLTGNFSTNYQETITLSNTVFDFAFYQTTDYLVLDSEGIKTSTANFNIFENHTISDSRIISDRNEKYFTISVQSNGTLIQLLDSDFNIMNEVNIQTTDVSLSKINYQKRNELICLSSSENKHYFITGDLQVSIVQNIQAQVVSLLKYENSIFTKRLYDDEVDTDLVEICIQKYTIDGGQVQINSEEKSCATLPLVNSFIDRVGLADQGQKQLPFYIQNYQDHLGYYDENLNGLIEQINGFKVSVGTPGYILVENPEDNLLQLYRHEIGLTLGPIFGIVLGIILIFAIIGVIAGICYCKSESQSDPNQNETNLDGAGANPNPNHNTQGTVQN